jgi:hypothetical protein
MCVDLNLGFHVQITIAGLVKPTTVLPVLGDFARAVACTSARSALVLFPSPFFPDLLLRYTRFSLLTSITIRRFST